MRKAKADELWRDTFPRVPKTSMNTPQLQAMTFTDRVDDFLKKRRRWIAAACCLLGALRILIFAAGFPLFNPVDEASHYEMVYEYSRGFQPGARLLKTDPQMARIFSLYGTDEYLVAKDILERFHRDVPLPALAQDLREYYYPRRMTFWLRQSNIETQSPPAYYLLAGGWYRLGGFVGLRDWAIAYWTRFLNAILYAAFIWVSYLFVERTYSEKAFLSVGTPLLLAVFPQDVFLGVNRDVLSPLLAALILLLLFRALAKDSGGHRELLAAGVLAGIAFLTEVSNFVLFGVLLAVLLARSRRAEKAGNQGHEQLVYAGSLLAAGALPLAWMARNRIVMGDFTAAHEKTFYLGWIVKNWNEMWRHPIFTPSGLWYFLRELTGSFWRGEIAWAHGALRNGAAEFFYLYSTLALLACFVLYFLRSRTDDRALQRWSGWTAIYVFSASVVFMAAISLPYDFQECVYPSRAAPYFVSGRIIIGALLPFVVMYLSGLEYLLRPLGKYLHPIFPLLLICAGILWAEATIAEVAFRSHFNFYSLVRM